jgi:hypothetical protein
MDDIEREYEYKPKWWALLLMGGYFALGALVCAYKIIHPWPENLPFLYGAVLVLSVGGVVLVGVSAATRLTLRRRVAFTQTSLLVPKPRWSSRELAIDYRAITALFLSSGGSAPRASRVAIDFQTTPELPPRKLRYARILYVTHTRGEQRIVATLLPSQAAFAEVCELLTARVHASQQVGRV